MHMNKWYCEQNDYFSVLLYFNYCSIGILIIAAVDH